MEPVDRQALELLRDALALSESRIYDHVSTTFRWLMATLFAANGGAIIALLSDGAEPLRTFRALGWFAAGVILAIVMGAVSSFAGYRTAAAIWSARMQVEQGLLTNTVPNEAIADFTAKQKPSWKTFIPTDVGVASLVCFIIGAGTVASSLIR